MLRITHIKAHLPLKKCQLTFLLRLCPPQAHTLEQKPSQLPLTQDFIDIDIDCTIQLGQYSKSEDLVQICAISIVQVKNSKGLLEQRKICVGSSMIYVNKNVEETLVNLRGVLDQDGYIIYCINGCQSEISNYNLIMSQDEYQNTVVEPELNEDSFIASRKFELEKKDEGRIKKEGLQQCEQTQQPEFYEINKQVQQNIPQCQTYQKKQTQKERSPFKKSKSPINMMKQIQKSQEEEENPQILDQIYHLILEEQLFNQRIWNSLQQNQIFNIKNKTRLEALIGESIL